MKYRQRMKGGLWAFVGFMLSPLSWWNDLFVNIPLALAFAWLVSLPFPSWFTASFVVGYWITNVLGFVLMHKGGKLMVTGEPGRYSARQLIRDIAISLVYTLLILFLIHFKILKPLPSYLPNP